MPRWRSASPRRRGRSNRELGVGRGDRVAILAANHPDYLVLLYACARLGRHAGADQLAAGRARAALHPARCGREGAGRGAGVSRRSSSRWRTALPEARIVGLDFAPPGGLSFADAAAGCQRRWPQRQRRYNLPAADRLHLRHHRAPQGRGAAPGGADLERGDEPAHARHDGRRITCSPCCRCSMSAGSTSRPRRRCSSAPP